MAHGHGGKREGAGRKPNPKRQELIEALLPHQDNAIQRLIEGINTGSYKHLKMYFEYVYGRPVPTQYTLNDLIQEYEKHEQEELNYDLLSDDELHVLYDLIHKATVKA